ncbi:ABC transporter permease [Terriglobus saanensis]|uniref:Permease n=1 Tax=Terriglobus saanensis (strain ATCC BAA-1853 / DSM 23119 / SP1PR4) TaxID=401053 RepID=E8V2V1_TERSS|nr:ABC transporter permease [Terriglobus saanensis]ADV84648.1 permease [Terriglobus saanensis SP1PR4]
MKLWRIRKRDADLQRELQCDLELEEEEQRESGLSAEEARYAARRAFGNVTLIREQTHEAWGSATFERLLQDARYAMRQLRRSPAFSLVTMLTLALGIGATTAIFTLVYDVMLRPLPFAQADRIVTIEERVAEWSFPHPNLPVSANHFTFWQQHNSGFDSIALMRQFTMPLGRSGRPMQAEVLQATPGIFSVLQVQPSQGRVFTVEEAQIGREYVAVLTYDTWREQFGGDPAILGKPILLDGFSYKVIGVMPPSFHMPQIVESNGSAHRNLPIGILLPLAFSKERLAEEIGDFNYFGLARLKTGVSIPVANAELNALQQRISANLRSDERATLSATITPFQEKLVGNNQKPLIILLVAVAGLLLVGCVNVANLLLSRAIGNKKQIAIAAALGAGRAEMMRMAIREITLLAVLGGGLGVLLAAAIIPVMQRYLPAALDFRGPLHLDWTGAGCALFLAMLSTLAAGAAPAFMVSRTSPQEALQSDSRLSSESPRSRRARLVLVGVEAAVSVALVLMTGLLTASLVKLMKVDRGFTTERTITATVDLPTESYRDSSHRAAFYREVLGRMAQLPGVEHAAIASVLPLTGDSWGDFARVTGDHRPITQLPLESFRSVSPEYFASIHLPVTRGEIFNQKDWGRNLALVSEKTARTLWPGKDPIGQQFNRGDPTEMPFTVVGIVADARTISLAKPDPMLIYVPYWYRCEPTAGLVVRTRLEPTAMEDTLRQTIWSVDPGVPVPTVRALGGMVADSVANQRFEMDLLLLFAVCALFLAGLGVYGVLMYSVTQRYREIGLRLALGAKRANVYRLVLRDGLLPVIIGAAAGVALAFGSSRLLTSLLFEVSPYDPLLTAGAVGVLLAVGTVGCLLPARRAASVEPMLALRAE